MLERLPDRLRGEWEEIKNARGQEAMRILDSSRNRLKPYFESDILRRIFGSSQHRLDMLRMMEEGRIVESGSHAELLDRLAALGILIGLLGRSEPEGEITIQGLSIAAVQLLEFAQPSSVFP